MEGIVLSRMQYREVDQMITLYSKEAGLQRYVAKGIKKIQSKNSAAVEPFSYVSYGTASGKEYDYLTSVQIINYHSAARQDLQTQVYLSHICKSLVRLLEEGVADTSLFEHLSSFLNKADTGLAISDIDHFFFILMGHLGFVPDLSEEVQGYDLAAARFLPESVGVPISAAMRGWFRGISEDNLNKTAAAAIHQIVLRHLRYHSEQGIRDWKELKIG